VLYAVSVHVLCGWTILHFTVHRNEFACETGGRPRITPSSSGRPKTLH